LTLLVSDNLLPLDSAVALRAAVAKLVGLKHTPELHFRRNTLTLERRRMEEAWQVRVCALAQACILYGCVLLLSVTRVTGAQELERERDEDARMHGQDVQRGVDVEDNPAAEHRRA
jgi:hypothetical protein